MERDTLGAVLSQSRQQFQLTRSRGAWRNGKCCKYWFYISTHTLTWSVTVQIRQFLGQQTFQLTRSRGAWPQKNSPKAVIKIISTHTLTWSVTTAVLQLVRITKISTHTLTWSVTCIIDKTIRFVKFQLTRSRGAWPLEYSDSRGQTGNFNSHAHVERDLICLKSQKIIIHISTHTLTWSVTTEKQP